MPAIDKNPKFTEALELLEHTGQHVLITGRAGTGKSTLLSYFRGRTKKNAVVLAPTGVAAVNIGGQTIHSFCGFRPDITIDKVKKISFPKDKIKLIKKLDTLVIDEVSMVRADLLDCVDKFLRLNGRHKHVPFGGIQMAFFGDLYQLPPVVTGAERSLFGPGKLYQSQYFFDARVLQGLPVSLLELEKVYRQTDQEFVRLLNAIRNKSFSEDDLLALNGRHDTSRGLERFAVYLATTNEVARSINTSKLGQLSGKVWKFKGILRGKFEERSLPTDQELYLKKGAQVMLLNNDSADRWVNGTLGVIKDVTKETDDNGETAEVVRVELESGAVESVARNRWDMYRFYVDDDTGRIGSESVGSFIQFPLRLAWALTIHKAQGKTFDRVHVDFGRGTFEHGQAYVALSRCRTLAGLTLERPVQARHVLMDWRVVKFLTDFQYQAAHHKQSVEAKLALLEQAAKGQTSVTIEYLKSDDTKSRRRIRLEYIGELSYEGRTFLGVEAYCYERKAGRVFRVDRILSVSGDAG